MEGFGIEGEGEAFVMDVGCDKLQNVSQSVVGRLTFSNLPNYAIGQVHQNILG